MPLPALGKLMDAIPLHLMMSFYYLSVKDDKGSKKCMKFLMARQMKGLR